MEINDINAHKFLLNLITGEYMHLFLEIQAYIYRTYNTIVLYFIWYALIQYTAFQIPIIYGESSL